MENVKKQLIEIEEAMVKSFNENKIEESLGFFDTKFIGFSSTAHDRLGGLDALKQTFEYYLNQSTDMEFHISSPVVQLFDQTAVVSFYWVVVLITGDSRKEINGRGTHVFNKIDNKWKIVHEHFSKAH